jgi:hypothetical protein
MLECTTLTEYNNTTAILRVALNSYGIYRIENKYQDTLTKFYYTDFPDTMQYCKHCKSDLEFIREARKVGIISEDDYYYVFGRTKEIDKKRLVIIK